MYPGQSDAHRWASMHCRELVDEGLRQQVAADALRTSVGSRLLSSSLRHRLGRFLVRAGRYLHRAHPVTGQSGPDITALSPNIPWQ
jgi:hypothetical protein